MRALTDSGFRRASTSTESVLLVTMLALSLLIALTVLGRKVATLGGDATAALDGRTPLADANLPAPEIGAGKAADNPRPAGVGAGAAKGGAAKGGDRAGERVGLPPGATPRGESPIGREAAFDPAAAPVGDVRLRAEAERERARGEKGRQELLKDANGLLLKIGAGRESPGATVLLFKDPEGFAGAPEGIDLNQPRTPAEAELARRLREAARTGAVPADDIVRFTKADRDRLFDEFIQDGSRAIDAERNATAEAERLEAIARGRIQEDPAFLDRQIERAIELARRQALFRKLLAAVPPDPDPQFAEATDAALLAERERLDRIVHPKGPTSGVPGAPPGPERLRLERIGLELGRRQLQRELDRLTAADEDLRRKTGRSAEQLAREELELTREQQDLELAAVRAADALRRELARLNPGTAAHAAKLEEVRRKQDELAAIRDRLNLRGTSRAREIAGVIQGHLEASRRDLGRTTDPVSAFSGIVEGTRTPTEVGKSVSATIERVTEQGHKEKITVTRTAESGGRSRLTISRIIEPGFKADGGVEDGVASGQASAITVRADVQTIEFVGDRRVASIRFQFDGPKAEVEGNIGRKGFGAEGTLLIGGQVEVSFVSGDPNDLVVGAQEIVVGGKFLEASAGLSMQRSLDAFSRAGGETDLHSAFGAQFDVAEAKLGTRRLQRVGDSVISIDAAGRLGVGVGIAAEGRIRRDPRRGDTRASGSIDIEELVAVGVDGGVAKTRIRRGVEDFRVIPPELNDVFDDLEDGKLKGVR